MDPRTRKSALRVLVVDDEGLIADTLAQILQYHSYSAEALHSGAEAVARAKVASFDVMIADVVMPGMNGIETGNEVCKILRRPVRKCGAFVSSDGAVAGLDWRDRSRERTIGNAAIRPAVNDYARVPRG